MCPINPVNPNGHSFAGRGTCPKGYTLVGITCRIVRLACPLTCHLSPVTCHLSPAPRLVTPEPGPCSACVSHNPRPREGAPGETGRSLYMYLGLSEIFSSLAGGGAKPLMPALGAHIFVEATNNTPVVTLKDGKAYANSIDVAEYFGKRHANLLDLIDAIVGEDPAGGVMIFHETPYKHPQNGQTYRYYEMTRDGFVELVMGFTGAGPKTCICTLLLHARSGVWHQNPKCPSSRSTLRGSSAS